jgi:hypothetical protein
MTKPFEDAVVMNRVDIRNVNARSAKFIGSVLPQANPRPPISYKPTLAQCGPKRDRFLSFLSFFSSSCCRLSFIIIVSGCSLSLLLWFVSALRKATVGAQDLTVDPAPIRAGKERHHVGNVFRLAKAFERSLFTQLFNLRIGLT